MPEQTFAFADLAGFTALTESHGDETAADLACRFADEVADLARSGGKVVKAIGDAVMLRFDDADAALGTALALVGEGLASHGFPAVRVGVHRGSAVERNDDWYGAAVNIAARVTALASAREALVTDAVRAVASARDDVQFVAHGVHHLRNVGQPVQLWRVQAGGGGAVVLPIDPVCRMAVDPSRAAGRLRYEGREHVFCSLACASAFAAAPERYADV